VSHRAGCKCSNYLFSIQLDHLALDPDAQAQRHRGDGQPQSFRREGGVEAAGATVQYLPRYSPDLNPIEMPFSKFKAFLRKISERIVRSLCRRIGSFVPTFSRAECRNYFRHASYAPI
jgi:transposase